MSAVHPVYPPGLKGRRIVQVSIKTPEGAVDAMKMVEQALAVLVKQYEHAPFFSGKDEALGNLIRVIFLVAAEFNGLWDYGLSPAAIQRALEKNGLTYAAIAVIRKAVDAIAKPLEEDWLRRLKASPIKSIAAGDRISEGILYWKVICPAIGLFDRVRQPTVNTFTGLDFISGNKITLAETKKIKALKKLPQGCTEWTKLITQLTLSGRYWASRTAMKPGGEIYKAIAESAMRNRQGKARRGFQKRFKIATNKFLKLSHEKMMEVKDHSPRSNGEPLDASKAELAKQRTQKIESMRPTRSELKSRLTEAILSLMKTVPRNLPQIGPNDLGK